MNIENSDIPLKNSKKVDMSHMYHGSIDWAHIHYSALFWIEGNQDGWDHCTRHSNLLLSKEIKIAELFPFELNIFSNS